jgi:hypothetical protein
MANPIFKKFLSALKKHWRSAIPNIKPFTKLMYIRGTFRRKNSVER